MRTILGLFISSPESDLESTHFGGNRGIEVEEKQTTLNGLTVYSGTAATVNDIEIDSPIVNEEGEIDVVETKTDEPVIVDWFACLDSDPGFVAVSSSKGDFAFNQISTITGGEVLPARYDLNSLRTHLDSQDANYWQVVWSDESEAGTWYPSGHDDSNLTEHGLDTRPQQFGFEYLRDGRDHRGTVAGSGYLELFSPDFGEPAMAQFIIDEVLRHSGVEDVGSADDIAEGNADTTFVSTDETDETDETDDEQTKNQSLDDLETVEVTEQEGSSDA